MANSTEVYRRETADGAETVTIMSYIGADSGDSDEIRRIVERDGAVVEDNIAYYGAAGTQWLEEQRATYTAEGFQKVAD
jgi:hypothetical protein